MAQTPFSTTATTYFGQAFPLDVVDSTGTFRRFWCGQPGAMIQLPSPNAGFTLDSDASAVEHPLLSGGSAVTRRATPKRRYTLTWGRTGGRDFQIIRGFWRRSFGYGPWCFVTPEDVNRISGSASLFGFVDGDISKWAVTTAPGALAISTSATPAIYPSGVMQWTASTTSSQFGMILDVATATTPGTAIPHLPAESLTFSIYAATATGTASVQLTLQTRSAAGAVLTQVTSGTFALTTTPQRCTLSVAPGALNTSPIPPYVVPLVTSTTASNPAINFSAPQVEYEPAATPWQIGRSVPRVVIPTAMSRTVEPRMFNNTSLVFAEV